MELTEAVFSSYPFQCAHAITLLPPRFTDEERVPWIMSSSLLSPHFPVSIQVNAHDPLSDFDPEQFFKCTFQLTLTWPLCSRGILQ